MSNDQENSRYMGSPVLAQILRERRRQIEVEGWTAEHDDQHEDGEMAQAAAAYAYPVFLTFNNTRQPTPHHLPITWPEDWGASWWKPKDRRRDLIRAAALIVAEIERLDRLAARG